MEDVLDVYTRPYTPKRPQVCLDETSRQLLAEVTPPLPMAPGVHAKEDYEYIREGVVNLFMVCEPLRGWRQVIVSDRRTAGRELAPYAVRRRVPPAPRARQRRFPENPRNPPPSRTALRQISRAAARSRRAPEPPAPAGW